MNGFQELTLELTDWCPSVCLHCSSNSGPGCRNQLGRDLAIRLVEEARSLGAEKVSFGGGEPTASADLLPVLRRTIELGMHAEVFSCGFEAGAARPAPLRGNLLDSIKHYPRLKMIFSIHGGISTVHDRVTQTPGSFDALIESVRACQRRGITCEMNFVPMRVNADEFGALISLAEGLDIARVSVLRFVPQGRGLKNVGRLELSAQEEDVFVAELMRLRTESGVDIRTGSPFNGIVPGNAVPCRAGTGKLVVQATGNVLPCEVFKHDERKAWNLSVHRQSILEIITSPAICAFREIFANSTCPDCPIHKALRDQRVAEIENDQIPGTALHT